MSDLTKQSQFFQDIAKSKGIDEALSIAGNFHKYQYKLVFFLGVQWLLIAFVLMIQPFLIQSPIFLCKSEDDPSQLVTCTEKQSCAQGVIISDESSRNAVTEFGLYCDRASYRDLAGSVFFLGGSIGTLAFSYIADKYGRRKGLFIAYAIGAIAAVFWGLTPNLFFFYVFLALTWGGFDAYFASCFIIVSEAGGVRLRGIANAILFVLWGIGLCVFIGIAYILQSWREEVFWAIAIPSCISVSFFLQIYESPRFLFVNQRYKECGNVLALIAQTNGRLEKTETLVCNDEEVPSAGDAASKQELKSAAPTNYATIFTNPFLRKRFLLYTSLVVYLYLAYNGILFSVGEISGGIYVNSLVVSLPELFSYIVSMFILDKVKRKKSFELIMVLAAFGGIFLALVPVISNESFFFLSKGFLERLMYLIVKFAISLSFALIFVYGAELFPTSMRSKCVGLAASTGRATGMITTWLNSALLVFDINPVLFFGCLGFVMLIVLKWLPETYGCKLQDEISTEEDDEIKEEENENSDIKDPVV